MTDDNQTSLTTGVSSGIGHALAIHYLNRKNRVCGISRRTPADLTQRENFRFENLDLLEFDKIAPGLDRLLSGLDRLDLMVLNAGILGRFSRCCRVLPSMASMGFSNDEVMRALTLVEYHRIRIPNK
jgi:NAD(P)-dependent dehydrogenase (short-subunit alcohol dehydrogenase family)